jgi:hypothetical protein
VYTAGDGAGQRKASALNTNLHGHVLCECPDALTRRLAARCLGGNSKCAAKILEKPEVLE